MSDQTNGTTIMRSISPIAFGATLILAIGATAFGHGFAMHRDGNKIVAESENASVLDERLYNGSLSPDRDPFGIGAIVGGGFNVPPDSFTVELFGPLLYSNGGPAVPADPGITLTFNSYTSADQTTLVDSAARTSASTGIESLAIVVDDAAHDSILCILTGGAIPAGVYGVGLYIKGLDEGNPLTPFESSSRLAVTFRTPGFSSGDTFTLNAARMAIFSAATTVPGDFDSDGDVDGADFVAWQTNFPKPDGADLSMGDADGDFDVDGADFVVWQTHFPTSPLPGSSPVPEPSSFAILLSAFLVYYSRSALRKHHAAR
jgi:hypothetical protein